MPTVDKPRFRAEHLLAILAVIAVLALAAVFSARPTYRAIKKWRAAQSIAEVPTLIKGSPEDYVEAGRRVRVALGLAPQDPRVLRAAALYCSRGRLADGLEYWRLLVASGTATREDRLEYIRLAISFDRLGVANELLQPLLEKNPRDAEVLKVAVHLLLRQGLIPQAIRTARAAFAAAPTDPQAELLLGQTLVRSTNEAQRAAGRRRLWSRAVATGPEASVARAALVQGGKLTRGENLILLKALEAHTNAPLAEKLEIATLRLRLQPEQKSAILKESLATLWPDRPARERLQIANWAMSHDGAAELLASSPTNLASLDPVTLSVRLEAAFALHQWDEFDRIAAGGAQILPNSQVLVLSAVRLAQAGKRVEAELAMNGVLGPARTNVQVAIFAARTAERIGMTNLAVAAWQLQLGHPTFGLGAARNVLRLAPWLDDLTVERDALQRVLESIPQNRPVAYRLAYLNVLLGQQLDRARATFTDFANDPEAGAVPRLGLAFCQWRAGDAGGGLSIAEGEPLNLAELPPNWKAVYVGLLGGAGRKAAARELARQVDTSTLRSQEKALIAPWL